MNRNITYRIEEAADGFRISRYLRSRHYSAQNLIDLKKRPDSILLNGVAVFQNVCVKTGDFLEVRIVEQEVSRHIPPVQLPISIVYEDDDLIVLNKAAGMPIHTSMHQYENTLANALAYYYKEQGKPFVYRCVNRLDRDTSGLTIVAKHSVSAGILGSMVAAKSNGDQSLPGLKREYLAIVRGEIDPPQGTIDAPLSRKAGSIIERVVDFANGERAVTHYRLLAHQNGHSLVALQLETGRTHQIRVHMQYIGHPLIGDYLYNPDMEWITWEQMEFSVLPPEDMQRVIAWKG